MKKEKITIYTPLCEEQILALRAGDRVYLSGTIYTARDAAHQRMLESVEKGETLPFSLEGAVIYYAGPTPAREGRVIGSIGPTTSSRMDGMTLPLLKRGLKGMIGKGSRALSVVQGIQEYKAVYFAAVGGAGALISNAIQSAEVVAYEDLGPEAIRKLQVREMPLIVAIDSLGNNLYETEPLKYRKLFSSEST
ncbi:MAG TPA: Fe-S-containing hydro-lyase [Clostridiales bacterium]|nr:Fe-S-containing hydro-lyase [Clostridiales bacterium]